MEIIKQVGEFTKGEVFNLTQGSTGKISDMVDTVIEPAGWILYKDENNKGELQEVLVIKDKNGYLLATISSTFINQFLKMYEFMDGEEYNIKVIGKKSNAGRNYITCEVA